MGIAQLSQTSVPRGEGNIRRLTHREACMIVDPCIGMPGVPFHWLVKAIYQLPTKPRTLTTRKLPSTSQAPKMISKASLRNCQHWFHSSN